MSTDSRPIQPPIGMHALSHLPKPRFRGVSHFYALFVAALAATLLVATAPAGLATFAAVVYATTLVGMFGASALYHRGNWSAPTARRLLQLDHTAIFLLIAGTYTPIALLAMQGAERVVTLSAVWLVASAGIVFEWMPIPAPRGYVTAMYMFLGWIGAFAFVPSTRRRDGGGWPSSPAAGSATRSARSCTPHGARIRGRRRSDTTRSSTCS